VAERGRGGKVNWGGGSGRGLGKRNGRGGGGDLCGARKKNRTRGGGERRVVR